MLGAVGVTPLSSHTPLEQGRVATALAFTPSSWLPSKPRVAATNAECPGDPTGHLLSPLWDTPSCRTPLPHVPQNWSQQTQEDIWALLSTSTPSPLPLGHRDSSPSPLPCHRGPRDLPPPRPTISVGQALRSPTTTS